MRLIYKPLIVFAALFSTAFVVQAQNNSVSIGTTTTNQRAVLLLVGSNQGLVIPSVSNPANINAQSSDAGMIVYNSTDNLVYYYNGTQWTSLGSSGSASQSISVSGNVITVGTGAATANLSSSAPSGAGQFFMWDGSKWNATTISGDVSNATLSNGNFTVTGIQGKALPALPTLSPIQLLSYNGTTNAWEFKDPTGANLMLRSVYDPTNKSADAFDITKHTGWPANTSGVLTNNGSGTLTWTTPSGTVPTLANGQILTGNGTTNSPATLTGDGTLSGATLTISKLSNLTSNGLIKTSGGTGALSIATAGTDYAPATSGSSLLYGNGTGGFSNVTIGSNLTFSAGTLSAASGLTNPMTTLGDLIYGGASGGPTRLPIGANGTVLMANGGLPSWQTVTGTGTVTSVTGTPPISVLTGTTTPIISIPQASNASDGYLSAIDWAAFNGKQSSLSLTTIGSSGAATFISNVLNIPNYSYAAGTGLTLTTNSFSVNTSQNISTLSNLTSNGLIKTSGGTGALSTATAGTDYLAPFGSQTAKFFYAAPNASVGTPSFRAIVASDIPTLNQNTTGSAGSVANALSVDNSSLQLSSGTTYNGSAAVTMSVKGGGITNAMLANNSITIAGNSTVLGSSVTQDQITGLSSTGLIKRSGTNSLSIATAGTDFQSPLTLTTTGTNGVATYTAATSTLNVPNYSGWGLSGNTLAGTEFIGSTNAQDLVFKTNSVEYLRISSAGNVGVGTSTPGDKLHVVASGASGALIGGGATTGSEIKLLNNGAAHMSLYNLAGDITFANTSGVSQTNTLGTAIMTINSSGNVGIGTSTPSHPLDISGDMRISGYYNFTGTAGASGANQMLFAVPGSYMGVTDHFIPNNDATQDLGTSSYGWRNAYISGYAKLGTGAPLIQTAVFNGAVGAAGSQTFVSFGSIDPTKIISINAMVSWTGSSNWISPSYTFSSGYFYNWYQSGAGIYIVLVNSGGYTSGNIANQPYVVYVTYQQ